MLPEEFLSKSSLLIDGDLLIDVVGRRGAMRLSRLLPTRPSDRPLFPVHLPPSARVAASIRKRRRRMEGKKNKKRGKQPDHPFH